MRTVRWCKESSCTVSLHGFEDTCAKAGEIHAHMNETYSVHRLRLQQVLVHQCGSPALPQDLASRLLAAKQALAAFLS
mgnify:CR=1 FL=1